MLRDENRESQAPNIEHLEHQATLKSKNSAALGNDATFIQTHQSEYHFKNMMYQGMANATPADTSYFGAYPSSLAALLISARE